MQAAKYLFPRTIGIVFNLKKKGAADDSCEEYDEFETIEALAGEIKKLGFSPLLIEQGHNLSQHLLKVRPDFVLNIAEGIGTGRSRESQVPSILESLGIPYSGSDPISLGVALDKYLTSFILKAAGVAVPLAYTINNIAAAVSLKSLFAKKKLYIVKPRWEGSSKGIFLHSVVSSFEAFRKQAQHIFSAYKQPVLVEEFLEGSEITVAVCGNRKPRLLGMMRIMPRQETKCFLYSQENKREWKTRIIYEPQSSIVSGLKRAVAETAMRAFTVLELRDIARIDFRLNSKGVAHIIDINPLPGLSPLYSDLPIMCKLQGRSYSSLIRVILQEAFRRYGFVLR
ncbi:MAG: ATP-grasp domain-containing protein [Candidatus Omnitrophota bacterium]